MNRKSEITKCTKPDFGFGNVERRKRGFSQKNGVFFFHIYVNGKSRKNYRNGQFLVKVVNGVGNIN